MIHKIHGCCSCPVCAHTEPGTFCNHPLAAERFAPEVTDVITVADGPDRGEDHLWVHRDTQVWPTTERPHPHWCPLLSEPLTIKLIPLNSKRPAGDSALLEFAMDIE